MVIARIDNLGDSFAIERGMRDPGQARSIEVCDARIATGLIGLCMSRKMIDQLGLDPLHKRKAKTPDGPIEVQVFGTAKLTIQGRECTCDVSELPDDWPVLIGRVPIALMDFVVDPVNQQLIGNPAHGGEQIIELY